MYSYWSLGWRYLSGPPRLYAPVAFDDSPPPAGATLACPLEPTPVVTFYATPATPKVRQVPSPPQSFYDELATLEGFGGLFYDNPGGGLLVIRWHGDRAPLAEVADRHDIPLDQLEVRPADYTLAELEALQDILGPEVERLRNQGVMVEAVGVDEIRNRLSIDMSNPTEYQRGVIADLLGCDRVLIQQGGPYRYD